MCAVLAFAMCTLHLVHTIHTHHLLFIELEFYWIRRGLSITITTNEKKTHTHIAHIFSIHTDTILWFSLFFSFTRQLKVSKVKQASAKRVLRYSDTMPMDIVAEIVGTNNNFQHTNRIQFSHLSVISVSLMSDLCLWLCKCHIK